MAVVQEAFDIPTDILTKILTGEYRRIGGVVRYAVGPQKGQIVKHLDPIEIKEAKQAKGIGEQLADLIKGHKKATIVTVAVVAAAATGIVVSHVIKNRELKEVKAFKSSLRKYIAAIRNGSMDVDTIDELREALQNLKTSKNYEEIKIQLSAEELETLVNRIYDYTLKLAKDNHIAIDDMKAKSGNTIIDLQSYLEMQKKIFQAA